MKMEKRARIALMLRETVSIASRFCKRSCPPIDPPTISLSFFSSGSAFLSARLNTPQTAWGGAAARHRRRACLRMPTVCVPRRA